MFQCSQASIGSMPSDMSPRRLWLQAQIKRKTTSHEENRWSRRQSENLQSELEDGRTFCEWENTKDLSEEYDQQSTEFELCWC